MIKTIKTKQIYKDQWLEFYQDETELPDGTKGTYAYALRQNGVGVVVVSKQGKILLQKEHRYVIDDYSWEVQGGGIDQGESEAQATVRELKEEAGVEIEEKSLIKLGKFYPLNSFNTEQVTMFMVLVDDEKIKENNTEHGEHLEEHRFFTFDQVYSMMEQGKINDSTTATAVQLAMRRFESTTL